MNNETTASQPILMAYVATDLDGHADVGLTIESAKHRAGAGCDTIIALHDISAQFVELEGKRLCAPGDVLASQPKSIGDDAQFQQAFNLIYDAYSKPATDFVDDSFAYQFMRNKVTEAYSLMQRLRAPAAQASATIQAAPDDGPIPCPFCGSAAKLFGAYNAWSVNCTECNAYGPSTDKAGALDGWNKRYIAATIQEPIMVAEPVGKRVTLEELRAVICEDGKVGNYLALSIAEKVLKMLPAAPMVADPAGVSRRATDAEVAAWAERYDIANMLGSQARSAFEDAESLHMTYAATVKAVPSESTEQIRANFEDWYATHIPGAEIGSADCAARWSAWLASGAGFYKAPADWKVSPMPWGEPVVKAVPSEALDESNRAGWFLWEHGCWVATSSDDPRATKLYRAAPLADKTGGGE